MLVLQVVREFARIVLFDTFAEGSRCMKRDEHKYEEST
jgi:hypothetical protein